jgi:hypothetical protein
MRQVFNEERTLESVLGHALEQLMVDSFSWAIGLH